MIGAAIAGGVMGLGQAGLGIWQYLKGQREQDELDRPTYEIPPEISQNLTQAQQQALEGLPAEQKKLFVENIQRAMSSGVTALQEKGMGVAGVSALVQQQTDAYRQLLGADVAARQANLDKLAQARTTMAGFKEREFDINEMQPYIQDYLQAQAMMGSGMQNIYGGAQSVATSALLAGTSNTGQGVQTPATQLFLNEGTYR